MTHQDLPAELEEDIEEFSSFYRRGVSEAVKSLLAEWGLDAGDPTRIRVEKRMLPILERSLAEIVGELERALRPLAESSED